MQNDPLADAGEKAQKPAKPHAKKYTATMNPKRLGRELAMQYLFQCDLASENDTDEKLLNFQDQAKEFADYPDERFFRKAWAYAERLILGVQGNEFEINDIMEGVSKKWDLHRMSAVDRNIMRIAIFELKFCFPEIPPLASINEAIEIGKDYSGENAGQFINGVLNGVKNQLHPEIFSEKPSKGKA